MQIDHDAMVLVADGRKLLFFRNKGDRAVQLKDLSVLRWRDSEDTMVVSFSEALEGQSRTVNKRQYWSRENGQWKIFFEGPVG